VTLAFFVLTQYRLLADGQTCYDRYYPRLASIASRGY